MRLDGSIALSCLAAATVLLAGVGAEKDNAAIQARQAKRADIVRRGTRTQWRREGPSNSVCQLSGPSIEFTLIDTVSRDYVAINSGNYQYILTSNPATFILNTDCSLSAIDTPSRKAGATSGGAQYVFAGSSKPTGGDYLYCTLGPVGDFTCTQGGSPVVFCRYQQYLIVSTDGSCPSGQMTAVSLQYAK